MVNESQQYWSITVVHGRTGTCSRSYEHHIPRQRSGWDDTCHKASLSRLENRRAGCLIWNSLMVRENNWNLRGLMLQTWGKGLLEDEEMSQSLSHHCHNNTETIIFRNTIRFASSKSTVSSCAAISDCILWGVQKVKKGQSEEHNSDNYSNFWCCACRKSAIEFYAEKYQYSTTLYDIKRR